MITFKTWRKRGHQGIGPTRSVRSRWRGQYTPLMKLGTIIFVEKKLTKHNVDPALLYAAQDYVRSRFLDFESRRPQSHKTRSGSRFYTEAIARIC